MRRKIISLIITIFCLLFLSVANAASKLVVVKDTYDFGTVREGRKVHVTFTITNVGTDETRVTQSLPKSGCGAVGILKRILAPRESVRLEYIFDSIGYGGVSVIKEIKIHYDNYELSPLKLTVIGKVLPVEPYQAPVGELLYNFFVLVDIRSSKAFTKEHIVGSINVPYKELGKWVSNASKNIKDGVIIYLCSEDGTKSDKAAQMLKKKGFSHCLSLVGGLEEWKNQYGKRLLIFEENKK